MAHIRTSGRLLVRDLIFFPPFLRQNEIRRRRFWEVVLIKNGERIRQRLNHQQAVEMNDRWWEWERELGITPTEAQIESRVYGRPEILDTSPLLVESHRHTLPDAGRVVVRGHSRLKCAKCSHEWWPQESRWRHGGEPKYCPKCKSKKWKT